MSVASSSKKPSLKRMGVLTSGGDCPGLNAVLRAVTKSALLDHGIRVFGFHDGFKGFMEGEAEELNWNSVSGILTAGGTILGATNRDNPFRMADGKGGFKDRSADVVKHYKKLGLDGCVVVGGDGTMKLAQAFAERGLRIVGVPKTIDNDLWGTDHSVGFDTAVEFAAQCLDRLHNTAQSHHRIMVAEVMGRDSGWIGLYSGVAAGADVILLPEIPFDLEKAAGFITRRQGEGKCFSIVVVAEGAREKGKGVVAKLLADDPTHPERLGGVGEVVARGLQRLTGLEARVTVLGHLLRGGSPTARDRLLATSFGHTAVNLLWRGVAGRCVVEQGGIITHVSLKEATSRRKDVPKKHPLILAARSAMTSFGD